LGTPRECRYDAVMKSSYLKVNSELRVQLEAHGVAKEELFDYLDVIGNRRRRYSTPGLINAATLEQTSRRHLGGAINGSSDPDRFLPLVTRGNLVQPQEVIHVQIVETATF